MLMSMGGDCLAESDTPDNAEVEKIKSHKESVTAGLRRLFWNTLTLSLAQSISYSLFSSE